MPVDIYRLRHRESSIIQDIHVGKFLRGRDTREIQPACLVPVSMVVSLFFKIAEACATQPERGEIQNRIEDLVFYTFWDSVN